MNYFFRRSSLKESPNERPHQEASPSEFAPTTQQTVRDTVQRVESLRNEVRTVREDLVATLGALQAKEDDSEKLLKIVQMLEQKLHTASSKRNFAEDIARNKEQEVRDLQMELDLMTKEVEHRERLLSGQLAHEQ
mmetsp:Transcript_9996/g.20866  ORF Transcript_9996/g.20866 Transcript_9996/m.20866 type:complete len:135 (-) Transcript_9996:193-597(-)|eukprot:CAMPEP_0118924496 /NCGR_PEP_ID=MMETSP1169-20130426/2608_1 /TAXON_ID=36882 /ORGANISM="Pyramimonas obovata, Strain CCMP722" /LENGTH=134 /DNA_ID=CAMNT_0006865617 /DNA_START=223 /DNA_END=627 /DNA_ORIENTATION=-